MYGHHIEEMAEALVIAGVVADKLMVQEVLGEYWKDKIALVWTVDDVHSVAEESLSDEEAIEVLEQVENDHNAEYGVSWDSLRDAIKEVLGNREEELELDD